MKRSFDHDDEGMGMADKALVEKIVASKKGFEESDREWLSALDDEQGAKIAASCGCTASADGGAGEGAKAPEGEPAKEKPAEADPAKEPATNAASPEKPKAKTREEWLAEAPPDVRETVSEMLAQRAAEDEKLREEIAANSRGALTKDDLAGKPHAELLKLHKAVVVPPDHSGRGLSARDTTVSANTKQEAPHSPGWKFGAGAAA